MFRDGSSGMAAIFFNSFIFCSISDLFSFASCVTASMFKNSIPGMDDIMKQNPELMQQFTQAAVNQMENTNKSKI